MIAKPVLATLSLLLAAAAQASEPPMQRYQLREAGSPPIWYDTGRPRLAFPLPFDKPYEALTVEQQTWFRQHYQQLGPGDEPPYPATGLRALFDPILRATSRARVSGVFEAHVEVDADGRPLSVAVLRTPGAAVTDVIARIAMNTPFKPARCDGQPCRMGFPLSMEFR
jgi:hypothetical protein